MKNIKIFFGIFSLIALFFGSCASKKDMIYLQPSNLNFDSIASIYTPVIQSQDLLTINVSASELKAAIPFNHQSPYQMQAAAATDFAFKPVYIVDESGEIDFPVLGKIKLGGLTRIQATQLLREKIGKYILDPSVNLSFSNFKVTVLGEVNRPGSYNILQERITVLEALGLAGDMTIRGVRNNVLLVRERNGIKETHRLDLTSDLIFKSPYYYLTQNDVLYIEPNGAQVRSSSLGQNTNVLISVSSVIISILTLVVTNSRR